MNEWINEWTIGRTISGCGITGGTFARLTCHHRRMQSVPGAYKLLLHSTSPGDFVSATVLGRLLWDALKWRRHCPMQNPIRYSRHQTIYVAAKRHIYVESRALRASPARANDTSIMSSVRWSCLSILNNKNYTVHIAFTTRTISATVFSPGTRSSVLISAKHMSLGISLSCTIRSESPSSELRENVLSSDPSAKILSLDQAPQVIRLECLPRIGVRLINEAWLSSTNCFDLVSVNESFTFDAHTLSFDDCRWPNCHVLMLHLVFAMSSTKTSMLTDLVIQYQPSSFLLSVHPKVWSENEPFSSNSRSHTAIV